MRDQPRLALPDGLVLRGWTPSDAPALVLAQHDPLVRRYAGFLVPDRAAALRTIDAYTASWPDGDGPAWALSDGGGTLLGALRFRLTDAHLGRGSVGYWLAADARGRGVGTAALLAGTGVVFADLGWNRVDLSHAVENERSCALARRCGYRPEGTLRDGMRYPDGERWSDEHLHARLARDPAPPAERGGGRDPGRSGAVSRSV